MPLEAENATIGGMRPGQRIQEFRNELCLARTGPRPKTQRIIPHIQLDQWPPAHLIEQLAVESLRLPGVQERESRMASPTTRALWLPEELAHGPSESFIDALEFCHLHPPPEGSIHLTLPSPRREHTIRLGWAEEHPLVQGGFISMALVMVYAPRDSSELQVVLDLIRESFYFARG
jgi:phospholipase/carboxylesterase